MDRHITLQFRSFSSSNLSFTRCPLFDLCIIYLSSQWLPFKMSIESPLSSVLPIDSDDQTKVPSIESPWYKPDIGPRLKPAIKAVYEKWIDLTGDELTRHLHNIVCSVPPLTFSSNLTFVQYTSAIRHGSIPSIPVSENGCFFYRALH